MYFMRGIKEIAPETLVGILNKADLDDLQKSSHPPLHSADLIRVHLSRIFAVTDTTPFATGQAKTQHLIMVENLLDRMMESEGTMERIKATPLPLVYVAHLRTFLLLFLISMPYIWESSLGYITIPVVFLTAYAMLGLEGAAQEMEAPFSKDRTNHLNMDAYCLLLISNIQQQAREDADRRLKSIEQTSA
jgi:putative membrane protein